jgi:hypothetical protein
VEVGFETDVTRGSSLILASHFFHLAKSLWNQGAENINYKNMFIY